MILFSVATCLLLCLQQWHGRYGFQFHSFMSKLSWIIYHARVDKSELYVCLHSQAGLD